MNNEKKEVNRGTEKTSIEILEIKQRFEMVQRLTIIIKQLKAIERTAYKNAKGMKLLEKQILNKAARGQNTAPELENVFGEIKKAKEAIEATIEPLFDL